MSLLRKAFALHSQRLRSMSIEDCGLNLSGSDVQTLISLANKALKYLVLFPRSISNLSVPLPGLSEQYFTGDVMNALLQSRETHPHLTIFLKSEFCEELGLIASSAKSAAASHHAGDVNVDRSPIGKRDYERLVALGHIAAFKMYDEQHLLPRSYFQEN